MRTGDRRTCFLSYSGPVRRAASPPLLSSTALVLLLGACSTATPVVIQSGLRPDLPGRVNTTAGYTGTLTTAGGVCRGSFTGTLGQSTALLELSCSDGRTGIGRATIVGGAFQSGEVLLRGGARLTIRATGPTFP